MKLIYNLIDSEHTDEDLMELVVKQADNLYLCRIASIVFVADMRHYSSIGFYFVRGKCTYEFDELHECWLIGDY